MDSEIILVGNELLIGKIQDINGQWIIHRLLEFGHKISRITTIPDDVQIIADTIKNSFERNPAFVFISGGLGPTYDDLTTEGIAKAFNVKIKLNKNAFEYLKEKYQKLYEIGKTDFSELNESRMKIAYLPENSLALKNPDGAAPGILIKYKNKKGVTRLISMPGVPTELKAIFNKYVIPILQNSDTHSHYISAGLKFERVVESKLASDLKALRNDYPDIWIKTHPTKTRIKPVKVELHLTAFFDSNNENKIKQFKLKILELREKIAKIIENYGGIIKERY